MKPDFFHPAVAAWFNQNFAAPTPAQADAWPAIKTERNVLIAAPTGSGKTLAAFLAAIDSLVRQGLDGGLRNETQIVYVSPLKALSNDIQRNLEVPLAGIREALKAQGLPDVTIRTWVRTGDTPQAERQRNAKLPPHILVTTPESALHSTRLRVGPRHVEDHADSHCRRDSCLGAEQARLSSRAFARTTRRLVRERPAKDRTVGDPEADRRHRALLNRRADRCRAALRIAWLSTAVTTGNEISRLRFPRRRSKRSCPRRSGTKSMIAWPN